MIAKSDLEHLLKEDQEQRIIARLSEITGLPLRDTMGLYYRSRLAKQLEAGEYGMQYLDYKYLAEDLLEHEPELFGNVRENA